MSLTQTSPVLGLTLPGSSNPDMSESNDTIALLTAAILALEQSPSLLQILTAAGAVAVKPGKVILAAGTTATFTLAAPVAGLPSAGGNDGQEITFVNADGSAYKIHITTASSYFNGATNAYADIAGAKGNSFKIIAYGGVWYTSDNPLNVTLATS